MCCILQLPSNPEDILEQRRGILVVDAKADFKVCRQLYRLVLFAQRMENQAPHHFLFCSSG